MLSNPGDLCTHHFRSFIREVSDGPNNFSDTGAKALSAEAKNFQASGFLRAILRLSEKLLEYP